MVITVGRQYGSGGREIGTMLAKQLGIAYYDDMLLKEAAEESGLCEELFRSFDERPKSFLYSIAMDPYSFSMNHVTPKGSIEQQVYLATYDTIKKLADKGPCVLIGRCADYALKDRATSSMFSSPPRSRTASSALPPETASPRTRQRTASKRRISPARLTTTIIPPRIGATRRATTSALIRACSALTVPLSCSRSSSASRASSKQRYKKQPCQYGCFFCAAGTEA